MEQQQRQTILFLGNSLTAAYGIDPYDGWVAHLQQRIDSLALPYECLNAGISGETTGEGRERLDLVLRQPVGVLVLELGINDEALGVPVARAEANLQAIVDTMRRVNPLARMLVLGARPPKYLRQESYEGLYQRLADANGLDGLTDILEGLDRVPGALLPDGVHPAEEGHRLIAKRVWGRLEPLLQ